MDNEFNLVARVAPDIIHVFHRRADILKIIQENAPIGRRGIASCLGLGERIVRNEISFLLNQSYILVDGKGVTLTEQGKNLINELNKLILEISGVDKISRSIEDLLSLDKVVIARTNAMGSLSEFNELGRVGAKIIKDIITNGDVIAITGGTTIKNVIDNLYMDKNISNIMILAARGGVGKDIEIECNTIVSKFAIKTNGKYKMLHVPACISDDTLNSLMKEKDIIEIIGFLERTNVLIFGIGLAKQTAEKRGMSQKVLDDILSSGAEGEAFGCYFNYNGKIAYRTPTIGINDESISSIDNIIAVAAGIEKARAIIATMSYIKKGTLVTDEVTAKEILKELEKI